MSVTKLDNGRYKARYRDAANKEHAHTFDKKSLADAWERDQRRAVHRGDWIDPSAGKITFREFAEAWRVIQPHRDSTRDDVERIFRLHVYPVFGDKRMHAIRPSEIKAWVANMTLGSTARKVAYTWVTSVFHAAVQDRIITVTPCQVKWKADKDVAPLQAMTPAAVHHMVSKVRARYSALEAFAAGSGFRQSECTGLTVDRVDFLRREAKVDRQLVKVIDGHPVFGPPKSRAGFRTVPLSPVIIETLAAHLAKYGPGIDGLVFSNETGAPITKGVCSRVWLQAKAEPVPEWATFHDLRHFYASLLIHEGCSVKQVQRVLGHESAAMTLDVYGHWWPDSDDEVRDAVEKGFAELSPVRSTAAV